MTTPADLIYDGPTVAPDLDALRALHAEHKDPDPALLGKLPKPTRRDNAKGSCRECGGYHGLPAVHLDYMGHADVTDVLLASDPAWDWAPMSLDHDGLPTVVHEGTELLMWIRLTVHGVTRLGVGTAPKSKGADAYKELIGDALRNAAMRFGIGLALWSKADGVERKIDNGEDVAADSDHPPYEPPDGWSPYEGAWERDVVKGMNEATIIAELHHRGHMPKASTTDGLRRQLWDIVGPDDPPTTEAPADAPAAPAAPPEDTPAPDAPEEPAPAPTANRDAIDSLGKPDLVRMARDMNLKTTGKVDEIRQRIKDHIDATPELFEEAADPPTEDDTAEILAAIDAYDTGEARAFAEWRKASGTKGAPSKWDDDAREAFWDFHVRVETART